MGRKKNSPYKHSGKLVPLRRRQEIESDAANVGKTPTLDWFRERIDYLRSAEIILYESTKKSEADTANFDLRIAAVRECEVWLDMLERDSSKAQDAIGCQYLVFQSLRLGMLISNCTWRLNENYAVDGLEQSARGAKQAGENRKNSFKITRDELLFRCKQMYKRYGGNQRELADHVANDLPLIGGKPAIGGERVRQLMKEYQIRKADYSTK